MTDPKPAAPTDPSGEESVPDLRIPNYRVVRKIDEGGMGEVFEAEQLEPVRRKVAIKLVKLGMDSKEVLARFDSERQALAVMNHAAIAAVFDGGLTDAGRPYFVMEYVRGLPITDYCAREELDTQSRLELFVQVCQGTQHAHQKGVIHRDIKPSNVLVDRQGGLHVPKIIDFGLAKAVAQPLMEDVGLTQAGQLVGTPEYMSPEQFDQSGGDVDTRTDVYSLGILLYELLAGARPFDSEKLIQQGFLEYLRVIREEPVPRPSTRTTELAAAKQGTSFVALSKRMRGDLDWIVLKALEKERDRRYASVSELARDLERHLANLPVLARPPSAAYQILKFVRRHRVGVLAAALVVLALAGGVAGTSVALVRAVRAEDLASAEAERANAEAVRANSEAERANLEARRAARQAEIAEQISGFLVGLFQVVDPGESRGNTVTAREILDRGAARIDEELADQPEVRAALMDTMGTVYRSLGLYDAAVPLLERALEVREEVLGERDPLVAESLNHLGQVLRLKADYGQAEPVLRRALELRREAFGEEHAAVAESMHDLGLSLTEAGQFQEAEPLLQGSLDMRRKLLGPRHPAVAESLNNLAWNLFDQGDREASGPLLREALAIRRETLPKHPDLAESLNNLGAFLYESGDFEEAERMMREALDLKREILGAIHPEIALSLNNLAFLLHDQGLFDAAERTYREAVGMQRELLGGEHQDVGQALNNLAILLHDKGDDEGAIQAFRESVLAYQGALGSEHPSTIHAISNATKHLLEHEEYARDQGQDPPSIAGLLVHKAELLLIAGQNEDAQAAAAEAAEIYADHFSRADPRTAQAEGLVGTALTRLGLFESAESHLLESYATIDKSEGESPRARLARDRLVDLYEAWGRPEAARAYRSGAILPDGSESD